MLKMTLEMKVSKMTLPTRALKVLGSLKMKTDGKAMLLKIARPMNKLKMALPSETVKMAQPLSKLAKMLRSS